MFLSLTVIGAPAPDLGFILYKHPDRMFEKANSRGRVIGFFKDNSPERAEFCLAVDVDPVERVRGANWERGIATYVEPMPFLAASHLSQAISQALGSAMNGVIASKDPAVDARIKASASVPWQIEVKVGPVRCSPYMISNLFEALGWTVNIESHPLDVPGREDDDRPLHVFTLSGTSSVSDTLSQLYVMLPVLDPDRHYFYDESEVRKLFDKGGEWLKGHPYRDTIISRYLSKSRELRDYAHSLFGKVREIKSDEEMQVEYEEWAASYESMEEDNPHALRHARILEDVAASGARTVVDLGCGEGKLLQGLAQIAQNMRVVGVEPSGRDLERARKNLSRNPGKTVDPRIELIHGSALYADDRLRDFDMAVLSEVIEHIDPDRLTHLARSVFGSMQPKTVIVTTPNGDYNAWFSLRPGEFRHADHRFEWSREECADWVDAIKRDFGYDAVISGAGGFYGDRDDRHGQVSHYIVFTRKEG